MQVLLPLKEFAAAKQRLSGVLSAAERAQLFEAMVEDVLSVLTRHPEIDKIAICSRDHAARWLANYYDVEFIDETKLPAGDLNQAVNKASGEIFKRGENDVLVVHGDLPLLTADDISTFLMAHRNGKASAVTIAPDRRGSGTNLLAWRGLPGYIARYGEYSFQYHCKQSQACDIQPAVCSLPGACCDIDNPDDLYFLIAQSISGGAEKSLRFLRNSGIAERLHVMRASANIIHTGDDRDRA